MKELSKIFLKPGEVHIAHKPAVVSTVLGSCVAIIMHCPRHKISAICHATRPARSKPGTPEPDFNFVDEVFDYMFDELQKAGAKKEDMHVKLFGGAEMYTYKSAQKSIGSQNVSLAHEIISEHGLQLVAFNTGGNRGRKMIFNSQTGEVLLKRL